MNARRVLLIALLVTLGICAVLGAVALGVSSDRLVWRILWGAIVTAVACGLLLPLTMLTDRPRLRLSGIVAMATIVLLWLECLTLIVVIDSGGYRWEEAILMSFGFTLLMGIPPAGVALLVSFRWARVAAMTFVALAAVCWIVCELGALALALELSIYGPLYNINWAGYVAVTGMITYGLGTCACQSLINVRCGDRRYFRWVGIGAAGISALLFMIAVWGEALSRFQGYGRDYEEIAKIGYLFMLVAIVSGHVNLVLMARLRASQAWLQWVTIGLAIVGGAVAAPLVYFEYPYHEVFDVLLRLTTALGIATACGSVALIVLSMLNRKPEASLAPGALTATEITLLCPRCQTKQALGLGDAVCGNCELQISIKVFEPRCPACGYLLYKLTSAHCPECGAAVREGEKPAAAAVPSV